MVIPDGVVCRVGGWCGVRTEWTIFDSTSERCFEREPMGPTLGATWLGVCWIISSKLCSIGAISALFYFTMDTVYYRSVS